MWLIRDRSRMGGPAAVRSGPPPCTSAPPGPPRGRATSRPSATHAQRSGLAVSAGATEGLTKKPTNTNPPRCNLLQSHSKTYCFFLKKSSFSTIEKLAYPHQQKYLHPRVNRFSDPSVHLQFSDSINTLHKQYLQRMFSAANCWAEEAPNCAFWNPKLQRSFYLKGKSKSTIENEF